MTIADGINVKTRLTYQELQKECLKDQFIELEMVRGTTTFNRAVHTNFIVEIVVKDEEGLGTNAKIYTIKGEE